MAYDPNQQQGGYPQQPYQQQYPPTQQGYPPTQQGYQQSQPSYPQSQPANYSQYTGAPAPYGAPAAGAGFDFAGMWKKLMLPGQVASICGILLAIAFFFSWYSVSYLGISVSFSGSTIANDAGGIAFLMWLIPLAGLALAGLPIAGALGKLPTQRVNMGVLIAAGVALLGEIIFLIKASATGTSATGGTSVTGLSYGPSFGFYLAVLLTLAAGGVYVYFNFMKKSAAPGMMGMPLGGQAPYQQPGAPYQQPGSQPYAQPGSQPYAQPGSQPYPPQYQQPQPPQYPGQYPGQQPPQYPGQ